MLPFADSSNTLTSQFSQINNGDQSNRSYLQNLKANGSASKQENQIPVGNSSINTNNQYQNTQSTPQLGKYNNTQSAGSSTSLKNSSQLLSSPQIKHQQLNQVQSLSSLPQNLSQIDDHQLRQALQSNLLDKQSQIDRLQAYIQQLNFQLASKVDRCEYLRTMLEVKSQETQETEHTLKREILEITERLEILQLFTKREQFSSKQLKDKNTFKLDVQEQKLAKLEEERAELISSTQNTELEVQTAQEERELKLRQALLPLENARREIEQQMQIYEARKRVCEQHKERLDKQLQSHLNDQSKINDSVLQLNQDNQRLEQEMDCIKQDHPDEYEIFLKEFAEEQQLKQIISEKLKLAEKISRQEKYCKKLRDETEKIEGELTDTLKQKSERVMKMVREQNNFKSQNERVLATNPNLKRNGEIVKVERFLKEKESEYKSVGLFEVVAQETQLNNILLKYQVPYLEQALENLKHQFLIEDQKRDEELSSLKLEILNYNNIPGSHMGQNGNTNNNLTNVNDDTQDITSLNQQPSGTNLNNLSSLFKPIKVESSNNADTVTLKLATQRYNQALDKQKEQRFIYKKKVQVLQLKIQMIKNIVIEQVGFDVESVKLEYLKKMWARMNCDQDERLNFQNILELYIERVQQREGQLNQALHEQSQIESEAKEKEQQLDKKKVQLVNQQDQVEQWQQQVKDLSKREKVISKSLEERQTQIEFQLFKFGEKNFYEYYQRHEMLFEGVKKTYGKKVCDKMKTQQKREFIEITVQQYKRRIQELKDRQSKINENLKVLKVKELRLEEQVRRDIDKSESDLLLQESELRVIELQFQATIEALVEIEREIEMLKGQKTQEIKRTLQQMYKAKNYDSQKVRIQSLNEEISKKLKFVQRLRLEVEDKETTVFEKTTNYKAEEQALKLRLDTFKRAQSDLQKTIKPQLTQMEREIKELTYQVNTGRRKLESLFQKYSVLLQQQSMLKRTIDDQYPTDDHSQADYQYDNSSVPHPQQIQQFSVQDLDEEQQQNENHQDNLQVCQEGGIYDSQDTDGVPKVSSAGFQFDEEYKKMQLIIDADERLKHQPLLNQVIEETSQEYDEEEKSQLSHTHSIVSQKSSRQTKSHTSMIQQRPSKTGDAKYKQSSKQLNTEAAEQSMGSNASQKKLQNMIRLEQNMLELMSGSSTQSVDVTQQSQQSINIQALRGLNDDMLMELNCVNGENLAVELQGCNQSEYDFLHKIKILLQGEEIYKKFGTSSSMTSKPYDPLEGSVTPEQRGFGRRFIKLSNDLTRLDIFKHAATQKESQASNTNPAQALQGDFQANSSYQNNTTSYPPSFNARNANTVNEQGVNHKLQIESSIPLEKIMKLVVPTVTQDIIKFQKQGGQFLKSSLSSISLDTQTNQNKINTNKQQLSGVRRDQEEYKDKCLAARCFPFSLVLSDKTLEFVSSDSVQFKIMSEAIEEILKKRALCSRLIKKIQLIP